jgi:NAD(P)-dependent dehydrogenase (short-subunit alcohol dehydrogenase family)
MHAVPPQTNELAGRVAIITGANTGIGKATACALAARGATVILACRSLTKASQAAEDVIASTGNDLVEILPLDLADLSSIRIAAERFLTSGRPLHLLINNAGIAGQRGLTTSGFELAFGTNHIGHFLLTQLLVGRLAASAPSRIVNVSSSDHFRVEKIKWDRVVQPTRSLFGREEYSMSKLANVCFTQELARRFGSRSITALAVNPGPVASDIWRPMPRPAYYAIRMLIRLESNAVGARPSIHAAVGTGLEDANGAYLEKDSSIVSASRHATAELGDELWRRSEEWTDTGAS